MYKSNLKKKLFAALATVCAFVLLLVGIPFATSSASAAETRGTYIPDKPTMTRYAGNVAVKAKYTGDNNPPSGSITSLSFGDNTNLSHSVKYVQSNSYTEVRIPSVNAKGVTPGYFWVRSTTKIDNTYYQSDPRYLGVSDVFNATHTVVGRITSGSLRRNVAQNLYYSADGFSSVYFTCVYDGEMYDASIFIPSAGTKRTVNIDTDTVDFTVDIYSDHVSVSASQTISCSDISGSGSGIGGFAFGLA